MSSGSVLQVVILRNGGLVGTEMLVPGDYRIGRDPSCELHIDEPTLSRVHARLVFNGTRVGVQDLGSDNGVVINGEKIQAREVKSLDDVALGKVTLKFKIIGRKDDEAEDKPNLEHTQPLAARPDQAQLRAALEPVRSAPTTARAPTGGPRLADPDPDVTSPGQPPGIAVGAGGVLNATQPSARRSQVAPEIKPQPMPTAPPRPVIGLVPPPGAPAKAPPPPPAETKAAPAPVAEAKRSPAVVPDTQPKAAAKGTFDATVARAERPEVLPPPGAVSDAAPGNQPSVRARVLWGNQMTACRTFAFGAEIQAAERESAPLPVYQFGLAKAMVLARVHSSGWAVHVPAGVQAQELRDGKWKATQPSLDKSGVGIVQLPTGGQVRLVRGRMMVEFASLAAQPPLPKSKMKLELSLLVPLVAGIAAAVSLVVFMPKNLDVPDFVPQKLPGIRPALLAPPKKEEPKPKEKEKVAEKREPKKEVKQARPTPQKQPVKVQAPQAIAAITKLTSSPAMKNLMAVTSKIGGGGRPNGLKMVGLKGIGPVALAGAGPGIGGGFGGGPVTGGREQLIGLGGLALGKKTGVAGAVVQAPARAAQIHGSISREEIAKVINQHMQQIRACYEKALLHDPGLGGKLMIEWTIDMSGAVQSFKTKSSSMKNPDVGECILDNLKTWRFPRPTGGTVVVSYPFVFNSVGF